MMTRYIPFVVISFMMLGFVLPHQIQFTIHADDNVADVLEELGELKINVPDPSIKGASAEKGRQIIFDGRSKDRDDKRMTRLQSPYFKCISCHNTTEEYKSLIHISAEDKLDQSIKTGQPFLQASTFYGIVNRKTFYNDDYQSKYAGVPLIKESHTDIRSAIQLCATQCAQGRELADWEVESVLAYFWELQLKMNDLELDDKSMESIQSAINSKEGKNEAIQLIRSKYIDYSPAHFVKPISFDEVDFNEMTEDDLKKGEALFTLSCLHCHKNKSYSFFNLGKTKNTMRFLLNKTKQGAYHSVYNISRNGTYSLNGKKSYMPQYSTEKMSNQQLRQLVYFIKESK